MIEAQQQKGEILLRRYVLGLVSTEEQEAIESRLLTDEAYCNQLLKLEEELVEAYACGKLQGSEKESFERRFLGDPEWRDKVKFEKALNRYVAAHAVEEPAKRDRNVWLPALVPQWRVAMEAALMSAVVLLLAASALLFRETTHLREQVAQFQDQRSGLYQRAEELSRQLGQERDQAAKLEHELAGLQTPRGHRDPTLVSLVLAPGLSRSADRAATASLSVAARALRLELQIQDASYLSYRAELQTTEGGVVWSQDGLKANRASHNKAVVITLPEALITRSDYLVMLSGSGSAGTSEKIGTYYFRVVRK